VKAWISAVKLSVYRCIKNLIGKIGVDRSLSADDDLVRVRFFGGDFPFACEDFDPLIAAKGRLAAVVDGAQRAAPEAQQDQRRYRNHSPLRRPGIDPSTARREHFFHLSPSGSGHIESCTIMSSKCAEGRR